MPFKRAAQTDGVQRNCDLNDKIAVRQGYGLQPLCHFNRELAENKSSAIRHLVFRFWNWERTILKRWIVI